MRVFPRRICSAGRKRGRIAITIIIVIVYRFNCSRKTFYTPRQSRVFFLPARHLVDSKLLRNRREWNLTETRKLVSFFSQRETCSFEFSAVNSFRLEKQFSK